MDNNDGTMVSNTVTGGGNEIIVDTRAMENEMYKILEELSNIVTGGGNEIIVDTRAMENEIYKMLEELDPPPSSKRCIYRVPRELRKQNEEAYTPCIVSIGPFHHNDKNLESMEKVKIIYMKKLLRRIPNLKECIDFVKNRETKIRDCYSECFEMDSVEFVKMVLVDSCFVIQFLISFNNWEDNDDHSLYLEPMKLSNVSLDFILLENQVPFFVLEGLFSLATSASSESLATSASSESFSILDLSINFVSQIYNHDFFEEFNKDKSEHNFQSVKHFTHLALILYRPPPQESSSLKKEKFRSLCSSTNLTEVGVTFRKKSSSKGLLDITFTKGVLEIPSISLTDATEIQIRNLMALEHCRYPKKSFIIDYIVFIDCLINTTRDVDLLVRNKIIVNYLGDNKAAADLFNGLGINIQYDMDNFYFYKLCKQLTDYCDVGSNKLKAILKRDYFDTPWKTASTIAAITLLVLTLIQTVCSIMSTVNGK